MKTIGRRSAALALLLAVLPAPAARPAPGAGAPAREDAGPTGSVRGTFVSHERLLTRGATSQRDVVIYLRAARELPHAPPAEPALVSQRKLQFHPHVLPVLRGTRVRFLNEDDVTHNVFSTEDCCTVDLTMAPHTDSPVVFAEEGVASMVCRLHPEMSLWVVVLRDPWFTHVELEKELWEEGRSYSAAYAIEGVPPGTYTLSFWNKKLRPQEYTVSVGAGRVTELDVVVE